MEKLKAYNQKLLAVIGTCFALGILLLLVGGIFLVVNEVFRTTRRDREEEESSSIRVPRQQAQGDSTRAAGKKQITLGAPELVDTANQVYVIPVTPLSDPDKEEGSGRGFLLKSFMSSGYDEAYEDSHLEGPFSNLLIYRQKENQSVPVFRKLVNVRNVLHLRSQGGYFLLMKGTNRDSNQDNKLSIQDLQSFFLYDLSTGSLQEVTMPGQGLQYFRVLHRSDEVVLGFGQDLNKNGEISQEPITLQKISLGTRKISTLVDAAVLKQMKQSN